MSYRRRSRRKGFQKRRKSKRLRNYYGSRGGIRL